MQTRQGKTLQNLYNLIQKEKYSVLKVSYHITPEVLSYVQATHLSK